ncbi:pentapeptide repeat-containing protein [Aliiroseovarius crassostreae]|uniref:pentapeptide repeat-containing protein n=1 Tax=Aliiroseovarius crassostreae TaxID=154981 RepID=UPI0021FBCFF5|nr:pentapeptide repeat-containing protein [Aliiroseovarius crassostreae]UWP91296.1 pentapeptide repeat-containing protein [Aliiroseovarius crassostreae]
MLVQQGSAGRFAQATKKAGDRRRAMVCCGGAFNLGLFMQDFQQIIDAVYTIGTHPAVWGLLLIGSLGYLYHASRDKRAKLQKHLGSELFPPWLFLLLVLFWATIALLLFTGLLSVIWQVIAAMLPAAPDTAEGKAVQWEYRLLLTKLAALTTVLGATVALPFTIIRLRLTNEQTRHAENVLFNTKLNEAVESLHARYQVTKRTRKDGYVDIWKDDIIKRNGAIDRLEALAIERPSEAPRIARTLCMYLRELTREYPAQTPPEAHKIWNWAQNLQVKRSDMETAAQVLGRLSEKTGIPPKNLAIDLTGVNLQAMRLDHLNFEHAILNDCHLDGARLNAVKLNEAALNGAMLNGARLNWAEVNKADLNQAQLHEAQLHGAQLHGAKLNNPTDLKDAQAKASSLRSVNLSHVQHVAEFITSAFGDRSVILPDDVPFPDTRWPDAELNDETYRQEYRRFLKNPDAYIPPQHRND